MAKPKFSCEFCGRILSSSKGVKNHQSQTPECAEALKNLIRSYNITAYDINDDENLDPVTVHSQYQPDHAQSQSPILEPYIEDIQESTDPPSSPSRSTSFEDTDDGDHCRFIEPFPEEFQAGVPINGNLHKTEFEKVRDELEAGGYSGESFGPFVDHDDWELAEWLTRNVGQTAIDEYLQLHVVSFQNFAVLTVYLLCFNQTKTKTRPSSHNKRSFFQKIDSLPTGPGWEQRIVTVLGDKRDPKGTLMREELKLWLRNLVDCIKNLMQNPVFRNLMAFALERVYRDHQGQKCIYDEAWTADWWWKIQVR
jgi:hypothetical protein